MRKKREIEIKRKREASKRTNERVVRDELSREKGWCSEQSKRDEELPW